MNKHLSPLGLLSSLGSLLSLFTILGFFGGLHWSLDLFSHFRVQYAATLLIVTALLLFYKNRKYALIFGTVALANLALILPLYIGKPNPEKRGSSHRIVLMNILSYNEDTEAVLQAITSYNADYLILEEVTPEWVTSIVTIDSLYPHSLIMPRSDNFGIGVWSKIPFIHNKIEYSGIRHIPSVNATVMIDSQEVQIIATHPVPPMGSGYSQHRNEEIAEIPTWIDSSTPTIIMGDLNTSPWGYHFKKLLQVSGLKNSMQGFGIQESWPVGLPFLMTPLDHLLHSEEIFIRNRVVGNHIGSDHYPLIVDFSL